MSAVPKITLASGSAIRASMLRDAGIEFAVEKPGVDESIIKEEASAQGKSLEQIATKLATAKCLAIADKTSGIVIGSDQILEFQDEAFDKPVDMDDARARLLAMQGATHTLINAVVVALDGQVIWRHLDRPKLIMREMTEGEIDAYLAAAGPEILSSVGAYQVEKLGARLFDDIKGNYFAVLGMSLLPLLGVLRREGAIGF